MLAIFVIAISAVIALIDVRQHRIRNSHILILAIPLSIRSQRISVAEIAVIVVAVLIMCLLFDIGGGDFKLVALLVATQGVFITSLAYISLFVLSSSISLLISLVIKGGMKGSIPLAPSILAPFIYLYLGI